MASRIKWYNITIMYRDKSFTTEHIQGILSNEGGEIKDGCYHVVDIKGDFTIIPLDVIRTIKVDIEYENK